MPVELALALTVIVVAAGYLLACRIWPFGACFKCHGDGKLRSPSGKAWRQCKRCNSTGGRLRIGRRVLNRLGATAERGSR